MFVETVALADVGFIVSTVIFRVFIHESVTPDEMTQAISASLLCASVYFAEHHGVLSEVHDGAKYLLFLAMFLWTRKVQIQGPNCEDSHTMDLHHKTVLITGANSGIGYETAKFMFDRGAQVVVASRNLELSQQVFAQQIKSEPDRMIVMRLDLEDFSQVKEFAVEFTTRFPVLDIFVQNAGSMMLYRQVTKDGWESMMQTNAFSTFLLTMLLLPSLQRGRLAGEFRSRVVSVTSSTAKLSSKISKDLNAEEFFNIFLTYGHTKFAMNQLFLELASRIKDKGISVNLCHPGAINSDITRNLHCFFRYARYILRAWFKSWMQGANTQIYLATNNKVAHLTGKYFEHSTCHPIFKLNQQEACEFFAVAEKAVGVTLAECY